MVLTVDGKSSEAIQFDIEKDPRVDATQADLQAQFDLLIQIRDRLSETNRAINTLRNVRDQTEEWVRRSRGSTAADAISGSAETIADKLERIEHPLIQVDYRGARERLHLPVKLNRKLAELMTVVASADFAPARQMVEVYEDVAARVTPYLDTLNEILETDVQEFINLVNEMEVPAIVSRPAASQDNQS